MTREFLHLRKKLSVKFRELRGKLQHFWTRFQGSCSLFLQKKFSAIWIFKVKIDISCSFSDITSQEEKLYPR